MERLVRTRRRYLQAGRIRAFALLCLLSVSAGEKDSNQGKSKNNNNRGYHDVQPFCKRHYIQVTGVWLTCDTPGAYYYGSSAYRNSEVCMSGDKATLRVECKSPFFAYRRCDVNVPKQVEGKPVLCLYNVFV